MSTLVRKKTVNEIKAVLDYQYKDRELVSKKCSDDSFVRPATSETPFQSNFKRIIYNGKLHRKIAAVERLKRRS